MKISGVISELFYPSGIKCVVCGAELPKETPFCVCDRCALSHNTKFCLRCGRAINNLAEYCDYCQNHARSFDLARAPFIYERNVLNLVRRLKYGKAEYLGAVMARFLEHTYRSSGFVADAITFVPLHPKRERTRGFNQSEVIAKNLAEYLGIPLICTLKREIATPNLARMGAKQRLETIKSAFVSSGADIKGKNLVLVDDVFTTGATSEECSSILKKSKCGEIFVLTFATSRIRPELY